MAYASWSVVFGEQPSAAKWNILGTNDASFNDGTGIGSGVITPAKRSGGFRVGSFSSGSATTGNLSITGVGFTPKLVTFTLLADQGSSTTFEYMHGVMDADGNQFYKMGISVEGGDSSSSTSSAACLGSPGANAAARLTAVFVSMDADGFTINRTTNGSGAKTIGYVAYG